MNTHSCNFLGDGVFEAAFELETEKNKISQVLFLKLFDFITPYLLDFSFGRLVAFFS
jgi:hypothetical protein